MAPGIAAFTVIGLVMAHLKLEPMRQFQFYQRHESIGVTILLAAVLRLGWRLAHRPPPLPSAMPSIEKAAATGAHLALYAFLFAYLLTGRASVSSFVFNIPTLLYGTIPWPDLPVLATLEDEAPVEALLKLVHAYGACALIALVGLHAAAALRHHLIVEDDGLSRMLPSHRN